MLIFRRAIVGFLACLAFGLVTVPATNAYADFGTGSAGAEIVQIQEKLISDGYDIGLPDGVFGAQLEAAIKQYQLSVGLTPDGVVGPATYSKLMGSDMPRGGQAVSRGGGYARGLINVAFQYLGVPYVFGGTSPWGFDCSGFTQFVFRQCGISLPRTADVQYYNYPKVSSSNLRPGDLVFFETYEPGPSHCGIYIGGGEFIHAGSSTGVTVATLFGGYWGSRYIGAARAM